MQWTSLSDDEQARRRTRINACLSKASAFVNIYLGSLSPKREFFQLQESILLSTAIIVDTLSAAAAHIYGTIRFVVTRPKLFDDLLLANSWCPTTLSLLERLGFGAQGMQHCWDHYHPNGTIGLAQGTRPIAERTRLMRRSTTRSTVASVNFKARLQNKNSIQLTLTEFVPSSHPMQVILFSSSGMT